MFCIFFASAIWNYDSVRVICVGSCVRRVNDRSKKPNNIKLMNFLAPKIFSALTNLCTFWMRCEHMKNYRITAIFSIALIESKNTSETLEVRHHLIPCPEIFYFKFLLRVGRWESMRFFSFYQYRWRRRHTFLSHFSLRFHAGDLPSKFFTWLRSQPLADVPMIRIRFLNGIRSLH